MELTRYYMGDADTLYPEDDAATTLWGGQWRNMFSLTYDDANASALNRFYGLSVRGVRVSH